MSALPSESPTSIDIRSVYQPIVDLSTRSVTGFEALTRIPDANGQVSFQDVLRDAERQNVIVEFDWRCRLTALRGALAAKFPPDLDLFVNAEPVALDAPAPRESLALLADARDVSIVVEITERHLMRDPAGLLRAVDHARHWGWRVAVDDVGADPSSLALLAILRPDVIKLDMCLVQNRSTAENAAIVAAVIAESGRTGATVVAEGIETEAHEQWALDMGATLGQGYFYGPPADLPSFAGFTASRTHSIDQSTVTVRAPTAVTPYALVSALGPPRRADDELLEALENDLLRIAASAGASTIVLMTVASPGGLTPDREVSLNDIASCVALTAVFGAFLPGDAARYRAVHIGADEPLARERSLVVVSPSFTAALIALETDAGTYRYALVYDSQTVLSAATVLLRRIPVITGL